MMLLPGMVWDACCIINIVATNRAREILTSFGNPSVIVKEVREGEVFCLRPLPEEDPQGNLIPIDLAPLIKTENACQEEVEMTPSEQATFVIFAAEVNDGEARSLAVAMHRGLILVTDDRACIRLAQGLTPPAPVLTTLDWIKRWVDEQEVDDTTLANVLRRIEICAHYRPRRNHPLKSWWEAHLP